jgi:hypothetical protein
MRSLVLATVAALALVSAVSAAPPVPPGPYHMNTAAHRCQAANGKFVATRLCPAGVLPTPTAGATAVCRDSTFITTHVHRGACSHHGGVAHWL